MKTLADAIEYAERYYYGHLTIWGSPDYWRVAFGVQDYNVMDKKGPCEGVTLEEAITEAIREDVAERQAIDEVERQARSALETFVGLCPHCHRDVLSESNWLKVPPDWKPF